ncbi:hypothetical protein QTP70_007715 [Hemibagrus guttatus]|uniref:CCHC-type domain-containing protein n=1 Tax=Hemibagrus guttatus TaxID=175788 RepID=A0AAE0QQP7_9TELE|nr:hypothetical protein QTP70_007715 [Hemibagrus guttatus]KAK3559133.1 hypothetical protein QTP86_005026 [Hemibagrus guttatus]
MDNLEQWTPEEPLFFNPCMQSRLLSLVSIHKCLLGNGITKLGHLLNKEGWIPTEELKAVMGLRSSRLAEKLQEKLCNTLPSSYRTYIGQRHGTTEDRKSDEEFTGLRILPAVRTEEEDAVTDSILSFKAPQTSLKDMTKKVIYHITVKVLHKESLKRQKASRWPGMLNRTSSCGTGSPAKKVMLSNVPPFISDEAIGKELSQYGRMVSSIKKIPLGYMKCFKCGKTGHLIRACPERQSDPGVSEQTGSFPLRLRFGRLPRAQELLLLHQT